MRRIYSEVLNAFLKTEDKVWNVGSMVTWASPRRRVASLYQIVEALKMLG